ncbi:MAG: hypothetical protein A3G41_03545 [Elusimicrobia bacterium RIFCSPLOWO2_12_FULL_59_9]|nr:MAG: hypothetical protein A3G41_03545 [Elusimicrobia bacterium RIFCSPLOWO2_12_FULL_59_9]
MLKERRESKGISQRRLASAAGISYKTLQLLESGKHDPRLSTLAKVAGALGLPRPGIEQAIENYLEAAGEDSLRKISLEILKGGEASWKDWLFDFVDAFRRNPNAGLASLPPPPESKPRIHSLLASTVESLCWEQKIPVPGWCACVPALSKPWFVAGIESLKASALVESPAQFRKRNIFVLGNFLRRA